MTYIDDLCEAIRREEVELRKDASALQVERRRVEEVLSGIRDRISETAAAIMYRERALAGLRGTEPVRDPDKPYSGGRSGRGSAPTNPRRMPSTMTRAGYTPAMVLETARALFGRRGFTVNEFVTRARWERTSTKVEAARQLLQALVAENQVGRSSRCTVGYPTEVEYSVLDVARPDSPGALLSSLRLDVRAAVSRAVDQGWRPSAPRSGQDGVVWFTSPANDTRRFLAVANPRTDAWLENLTKQMDRVGAPVPEGGAG